MITALDRAIIWTERCGLSKEEILDLLDTLSGEDTPFAVTEAAEKLDASLHRVVPDPVRRATLLCRFMQYAPEEDLEPEEAAEQMQFLPLLLHAVQEIVETADSQAQAVETLRAIL